MITASTPLTLLRPLGESVRGQGAGDELDQVAALGAVLAVPRPRHAAARREENLAAADPQLLSAAGAGSGQGAGTVEKVTVSTDKCPPPRRESVLTKHHRDTPAGPGEELKKLPGLGEAEE